MIRCWNSDNFHNLDHSIWNVAQKFKLKIDWNCPVLSFMMHFTSCHWPERLLGATLLYRKPLANTEKLEIGENLNIFYISPQNIFQNIHTWLQIIVFTDWSLSDPWADVHQPRMRKSRLSAGSGPQIPAPISTEIKPSQQETYLCLQNSNFKVT